MVLSDTDFEEIKERDRLARQPARSFAERMAEGAMPEYARQAIEDRTTLVREVERLRLSRKLKEKRASG